MMSCLLSNNRRRASAGFTLIEMAIVMVILGALLGGLLVPLASQREINQQKATNQLLQELRQALIGYAVMNKKLPCPASATSNGAEVRVAGNACSSGSGFVPYTLLGVQGAVLNGVLVDAWQAPFRYSLTSAGTWAYAKAITITAPVPTNFTVCSSTPCPGATTLAQDLIAVLISTGPDGANVPATTSPHQLINLAGGPTFITHEPIATAGSEFDDQLVWIAPATLVYELSKVQ
ncbi:MAG TPA: type II secretion system protein [Cellvibrionaceae bacterium]